MIIHWEEPPEYRSEGMLHSVAALGYDFDTQIWLEERGVPEAWVYDTIDGARIIVWYE